MSTIPSENHLKTNLNHSEQQMQDLPEFKQHPYRIVVCLLFGLISFANGMSWVVVSPISKEVGQAYGQSSVIVALIPMSYLICYVFLNFPSNWVLDVKGIKKGIITGAVFTAIGTGVRCFVQYSFEYLILGQFLCAIAQPFILNSVTKIATRWFVPQNRSLALAILSVINIVGTAVGFVIPTVFVETSDQSKKTKRKDQFQTLLLFEFCFAAVSALLNFFFFAERPANLPSLSAMVEHVEFKNSIKILFTSKKFLSLAFAFATVNGAFNIYGSLLEQVLEPYGIQSNQISLLAALMLVVGIISAAAIGLYVQKTLEYRKMFYLLAGLGVLQTLAFSMVLKFCPKFQIFLLLIMVQGIVFIPTMPLCFDYGCDILFPVGEAQITGTLMTGGQIFGILFIVVSQQIFKLGDQNQDQKQAAFNTVLFVGTFSILGCITFCFFNSELKRSKLEKKNCKPSVLDENGQPASILSENQA